MVEKSVLILSFLVSRFGSFQGLLFLFVYSFTVVCLVMDLLGGVALVLLHFFSPLYSCFYLVWKILRCYSLNITASKFMLLPSSTFYNMLLGSSSPNFYEPFYHSFCIFICLCCDLSSNSFFPLQLYMSVLWCIY